MVDVFNRGRSQNPITHALIVKLFDLQVAEGLWLSLRWVPTANNGVVDAITHPGRGAIIRLRQAAYQRLPDDFGNITVDLMAPSETLRQASTGQ